MGSSDCSDRWNLFSSWNNLKPGLPQAVRTGLPMESGFPPQNLFYQDLVLNCAPPQGRFNYSISNKLLHNASMSFQRPMGAHITSGIFSTFNSPDLARIDFTFYYKWCLFQSRDKIVKCALLKWLRFIKGKPRELWLSASCRAVL